MTWREGRFWTRVRRNGTPIDALETPSTSESLDALTNTATFSPATLPTLAANDDIAIEWIDTANGITRYTFAGDLMDLKTTSQPQATDVPARGPLGKLDFVRKVVDGDLELTGMTDGEAVEAVLAYCGIDFDAADIYDVGYVLGERFPLFWRIDEPGSKVVGQIDEWLGCKTFEVGNARVIRRYYDLAPTTGAGLWRTYTKGASRDLWDVRRDYGRPDTIQNAWKVTGPTVKCGSQDACTCTPWAKAIDANPQTGSLRSRRAFQTQQTDILQDQSALEWWVRRQMRMRNRMTDEATIVALNDANAHPTSKTRLIDPTTYIDAGGGRYYIATGVTRAGSEMTIVAEGGPPGDEGTVTSGVEMICNDTDVPGVEWPGDFTPPDVGYPPIDIGDPFDPIDPDFGFPEFPDLGEDLPDLPTEPPVDPEVPDPSDPFTGCETAGSLVCPEGEEAPDTCATATLAVSSCTLGSPGDAVCQDEGWHRASFGVTDDQIVAPTYACTCHIETNLTHLISTQTAYYTNDDGEVERVTSCLTDPDDPLVSSQFYIGDAIAFNATTSNDLNEPVEYSGPMCIDFDYRFCHEGERIDVAIVGVDGDGDEHGIHGFFLFATPGQVHTDPGGTNPRPTNSRVDTGVVAGDTPPHHSYGSFRRNDGSIDFGSGLPLNTPLHGRLCIEATPDMEDPRTFWDNGQASGYEQHLLYLNEDNPVPGEPDHENEPTTHVTHRVRFTLIPHGDGGMCTDDCPGPQVWGFLSSAATCEENPDFIPPEGGE